MSIRAGSGRLQGMNQCHESDHSCVLEKFNVQWTLLHIDGNTLGEVEMNYRLYIVNLVGFIID